MVKSTTQNESVEFDLEKIRRFTETELTNLLGQQSELPFCYQIGSDVLVGKRRIKKINDKCWRVFEDNQQAFDFFTRKDAIFYCIALHKRKLKIASEIKQYDSLLNNLEFEATLYRVRYKKAQKKSDQWAVEYYSNKYIEIQHRISYAKQELKKNLNLAKYIKL